MTYGAQKWHQNILYQISFVAGCVLMHASLLDDKLLKYTCAAAMTSLQTTHKLALAI